jgi:hypothetical protein
MLVVSFIPRKCGEGAVELPLAGGLGRHMDLVAASSQGCYPSPSASSLVLCRGSSSLGVMERWTLGGLSSAPSPLDVEGRGAE